MSAAPVVDMQPARDAILAATGAVPDDCRRALDVIFGDAVVVRAKTLAGVFGVPPQTLLSRFFRAGLPSPTALMHDATMYRIAVLRRQGWAFARISYELDFSSPQALTRFVIQETGCRSVPYFAAHGPDEILARICADFRSRRATWVAFRPVGQRRVA